jgi:hypothetical protein
LDNAAILHFRAACLDSHHGLIFRKLFSPDVRYSLAENASDYIRGWKLPDKLKALFAACQVPTPNTPRLQ